MNILSFDEAGYGDELLNGVFITIRLAIYSFTFCMLIGALVTFAAISPSSILRRCWGFYASALMGVPSILVVFFIYYNAPHIFRSFFGVSVDVSPFGAGVAALSLVYSAYVGVVLRGAILMISPGQFDAAAALGLHRFKTWWLIILPQTIRLALPGLTNIWMILLKDTALVSMVGLADLIRVADVAAAVTKRPFLFYLIAGFAYILFSISTVFAAGILERHFNRGYVR